MKGLWFTEKQTGDVALSVRVKHTLHHTVSEFQEVAVVDTEAYGRMLALDGVIQTTVGDEFVYHEMISLVALNSHPSPRHVLIIGGGDGGTAREVTRHPAVESVTQVEIDGEVVEAARRYLPELAAGFNSPKLELKIEDGVKYVADHKGEFDVVIVDSTDPVGPAESLFQSRFYALVYEALAGDGMLVAQTESPFLNRNLLKSVHGEMKAVFPQVYLYLANIPTYPGGLWSFMVGSKEHRPDEIKRSPRLSTRYYTPQVHVAAFALPVFVAELIGEGEETADAEL